MRQAGLSEQLLVTINSDAPAYFGGQVADNLTAIQQDLGLSDDDLRLLAANSFEASFLDEERKAAFRSELESWTR